MYLEHDVGVPGVELAEAGRVVGDRFEILLGLGRRIGISGMRFLSKGNSMTILLLLMICVQVTTMQRDFKNTYRGLWLQRHPWSLAKVPHYPKIPSAPRPPPLPQFSRFPALRFDRRRQRPCWMPKKTEKGDRCWKVENRSRKS